MIAQADERFTKDLFSKRGAGLRPRLVTLRDEGEQALYVADAILEARENGQELKQQAVLFRASDASTQLELELQRRDIPFVKYGGLKFLEAAHVKDVLAILRFAQNRTDRIAGFRALQLAPGIGPTKAAKVVDAGASVRLADAFAAVRPTDGSEAWDALLAIIEASNARGSWPSEMDQIARWYEPIIETRYDDAASRFGDVEQLQRIAQPYPSRDLFLTELTLDPPQGTTDNNVTPTRDDDFVILSTIHSAKGQEWKNVFVLNVSEGSIPADLGVGSHDDIEEERRLLYVAMTRTKDALHMTVPQRFYVPQQRKGGDRHVYGGRSRFLPRQILNHFEQVSWPPPELTAQQGAAPLLAPIDVAARAKARWG